MPEWVAKVVAPVGAVATVVSLAVPAAWVVEQAAWVEAA
jgi:hypothetical protein